MKITVSGNIAKVETPYSAAFVAKIKNVGGARWDRDNRAWEVPAEAVDDVRAMMLEVYGEDDRPTIAKRVDVKLTFADDVYSFGSDVTILGRCISHASGRDSGARAGDGVTFLSGAPEAGGSAKNWRSTVRAGSIVMLRNVPCNLLDNAEYPDGVTAEIIEKAAASAEGLRAERDKLLARVEEINKILAKLGE